MTNDGSHSDTYDSFGNRKTQSVTGTDFAQFAAHATCNNNQATSTNLAAVVKYDQAGNIMNDGVNSYVIDAESRVCSYYTSVLNETWTNVYDAGSHRVAKGQVPGGLGCATGSNFVPTETDVLGQSGEQFSTLNASGWLRTNVYANGQLLATYEGNQVYFALNDWLGTKRVVTYGNGQVADKYQSLWFGDAQNPSSGGPSDHHYTGKLRDPESGLDYFGARYYASNMGRFLSPDPVTVTSDRQIDPQQLNLYSYVRNNPLTLTDPSGMIINTDDLNDKDEALWAKLAALANKQNADGSYVNPTLHSAYSALDSDSRTFRIEDDKSLGASTAGRFEITKFNGPNDFSEAKVELNFGVIKDISSTTPGNYDSSFQKYDGLFGKNGFLLRLTETFGHEASHGVFAINDPAQGSNIQRLVNDANGAMTGVKQPIPPDVLQKVTNMNRALEPTERFAQQQEKIINKELQQKQ